jgi:hypothetical protein
MSTRSIQRSWRPTLTAPFIALALATVLLVLGAQVSAFWGSTPNAPMRPGPAVFLPASSGISTQTTHLPAGCRPKFGC